MESHRLFFDQQPNRFTEHPMYYQAIEHGLHETLHEMVKPPLPLTRTLGGLILRNLSDNAFSGLATPLDRLDSLECTIAFLERISRTDKRVAEEAEELAANFTFQHRFLQ